MNKIEMHKIQKVENYVDYEWFIDGMGLCEYLDQNIKDKMPGNFQTLDDLCPAWTKELDFYGDVRFVWKLLEQEKAVVPILLCPEDLDFSCIVLVVEIDKTRDFVYWNRIGRITHESERYEEEVRHGILDFDTYTDEDWNRYGENVANAQVDSEKWSNWISENWDEELFRRRMNYTQVKYNDPQNVEWLMELNWSFERVEYEKMLDWYWEQETIEQLSDEHSPLNPDSCAKIICRLTRKGYEQYTAHTDLYGEVLLHIYASEQIGEPLFELLQNNVENTYVKIYCKMIELMWLYGDNDVRNVVDVTILERLSDDITVWNNFGKYISDEFKRYINKEEQV